MAKKAPRRTAERILEASQGLFNRFGEPNVSTTAIAAELHISAGNLYYHYPAKDELINALFARYEEAVGALLPAAEEVADVEGAWGFMHALFERIWEYRFLYRDLNDLLSRNRHLETRFQAVLQNQTRAMQALVQALRRSGTLQMQAQDVPPLATSMVVVLTYWLSFEYVRDPRHALEPESARSALLRGAQQVLQLLAPYLDTAQQAQLARLAQADAEPARDALAHPI